MRVFLTGATGFLGAALIPELIGAGHHVTGLVRSDAGAKVLAAARADAYHGSLEDVAGLQRGAASADAVIHCAYHHDFSQAERSARLESQAIEALGRGVAGTGRPLIITSVSAMGAAVPGQIATEQGYNPHNPRSATEIAGKAAAARGANVSIVRLAQVHNTVKQGFVSALAHTARAQGVAAYVGQGANRWAAVHLLDAARLYRLALERGEPGSVYHAVAQEGITLRAIAESIGRTLNLPVRSLSPEAAAAHFGWLALFASMDMAASSANTRQLLGWAPSGPGLLSDVEHQQPADA